MPGQPPGECDQDDRLALQEPAEGRFHRETSGKAAMPTKLIHPPATIVLDTFRVHCSHRGNNGRPLRSF